MSRAGLLLFMGDKLVFEQLQAGKITIGVAQELNRCTNERYRRYLLDAAIRGGATITVVKGWLQDWQRNEQLAGASRRPRRTARAGVAARDESLYV
jgi:hypothetical protein